MCNVYRLRNLIEKMHVLCIITIILLSTEAKKESNEFIDIIDNRFCDL